jgi:hypothetical protein
MKYIKRYNEDIDWDWVDEEKPNIPDDFKDNEIFYNFLVDNKILDQFIYNYKNENKKRNLKSLINSIQKEIINFAFEWSETPEGHVFWRNYDEMWRNII